MDCLTNVAGHPGGPSSVAISMQCCYAGDPGSIPGPGKSQ